MVTCALLGAAQLAQAGDQTWDFTSDPTDLELYGTAVSDMWQIDNGNPGGFLGLVYSIGSQNGLVIFPDIDNGELISSFTLKADIRSGNGSAADGRCADGFAVSLARGNDPFLTSHGTGDLAAGLPEAGTTTGIAISFDLWSGNTLPDDTDLEGIIIRVDNKTIYKQALGTRNGLCDDATSLQTGPQDTDFWALVPAPTEAEIKGPEGCDTLCWQPLEVTVDDQSRVTVKWKGVTILDQYQTEFFPSIGRIVLTGRTGGSNSQVHFDNISLHTETVAADTEPPTDPTDFTAVEVGSGRVLMTWSPSTDNLGRVGYEILRDGTVIAGPLSFGDTDQPTYEDRDVAPESSYTYGVRAVDLSDNQSGLVTISVTTEADVDTTGYLLAEIWDGLSGVSVYNDFVVPALNTGTPFDRVKRINGLQFGEWNGFSGNIYGDNYGMRVQGILTPVVTGDYRFFVRVDDQTEFHLNLEGTDFPNPDESLPVASDTAECCQAFQEPGEDPNGTSPETYPTSEPVHLEAGQHYGFTWLVKEGGGGDWAAVAWRMEGDTTPAANLQPINGIVLSGGVSDPYYTTIDFTESPQDATVTENQSVSFTAAYDATTPYPAAGSPGVWHHWLRNGEPVPGGTGLTLTIPVVPLADNGAEYSLRVGAAGVVEDSPVATLTVNVDDLLPTILSVGQADASFTKVQLTFSEPVTSPTATTASNYTLDNGATVTSAELSADGFSVTLTTSTLGQLVDYTLTVNNVEDNKGNAIAANTQVQFTSLFTYLSQLEGFMYTNIANTAISDLTADSRYPNSPDYTIAIDNGLEVGSRNGNAGWNDSYGDNYGMRVTGLLAVPHDGDYHFFLRSDDASQFFLNTAGATIPDTTGTPTIREDGCCNAFYEPGRDQATTTNAITLAAGQQYGFVVLLKEGGGGDGFAVGMREVGVRTLAAELPSIPEAGPEVTVTPLPEGPFNIAWISFHSDAADAPDSDAAGAGFTEAPDAGYTQLLRDAGHTVTRIATSGTPDAGQLSQYDLVMVSRSVPSSDYQDANGSNWNAITRPIIVMGGYVLRNSRMGYTTGGTMVDSDREIMLNVARPVHPVFDGISQDGSGNMINAYAGIAMFDTQVQRGVSVNTDAVATGGTVLATVATADDPTYQGMVIGEWQAGATMANGTADTLAGHRLVFLTGSREADGLTSHGAGMYDLGDDGATMLLNAVKYMAEPAGGIGAIGVPVVADGNVTITFPAGAELETSPDLQTWTGTGDTSGSVTEAIGTGTKYYRARKD